MQQIPYTQPIELLVVLLGADGGTIAPDAFPWCIELSTPDTPLRPCIVASDSPDAHTDGSSRIHITARDHGLGPGRLRLRFSATVPDTHFADGVRPIAVAMPLDIALADGATPPPTCPPLVPVALPISLAPAPADSRTVFIDLWREACGKWGGYDAATGLFFLNGLTDITYEEALAIYNAGAIRSTAASEFYCRNSSLRTNLPAHDAWAPPALTRAFLQCYALEVANLSHLGLSASSFAYCKNLRQIVGTFHLAYDGADSAFFQCVALEDFSGLVIKNNRTNELDISGCPLVTAACLSSVISNAENTAPFSIIVHADVYAKLTDTGRVTEWTPLLAAAAAKNISFVTL